MLDTNKDQHTVLLDTMKYMNQYSIPVISEYIYHLLYTTTEWLQFMLSYELALKISKIKMCIMYFIFVLVRMNFCQRFPGTVSPLFKSLY